MQKVVILSYLIFSLMLLSCSETYRKYEKDLFQGNIWRAGQVVSFNPEITDISKSYKLVVGLRHHHAIQRKAVNINLKTVSPSGKETTKEYTLQLKNQANEYNSTCAGDLCDLEVVVEDNFQFAEAGQYQFSIAQADKGKDIPNIMEVGLIIDPVE